MVKTKRNTLLFRKKKYTRKKTGGWCMPWDKDCKNKRQENKNKRKIRRQEEEEEQKKQSRLLKEGKKRVEDLWEKDKIQLGKSYHKYFSQYDEPFKELMEDTSYTAFISGLELLLKALLPEVEEVLLSLLKIKKNTSIIEKENKRTKYKKLVERLEEIQKYHNNFKWSKWFSKEDRPYLLKIKKMMEEERQTDVVDDDDDEAMPVDINAWDTKNLKEGIVERYEPGPAGFIGGKRRRTKRKKRRRRNRTKRK